MTLTGVAVSVLVASAVMVVAAAAAARQGRVAVVDVAWGLGLAAVAIGAAVLAVLHQVDPWRAVAGAGVVGVWGLRLAWHIHRRNPHGEDPRYEHLLGGPLADVGMGVAVRKVFALQGAALVLVALPLSVGLLQEVAWWPVVVAGVALALIGIAFEAIGDAQLAAYQARPREQRPDVLDTGLWRYTRHPNYFGDACLWWGVWLMAGLASGPWVGAATVAAPIAMTYFLVWATGARLLEQTMTQRPPYREYAARTSMFLPLPPRRQ